MPAAGQTSAVLRAMSVQGAIGMEYALANATLLAAVDALRHSPQHNPVATLSARFKELLLRHAQLRQVERGEL